MIRHAKDGMTSQNSFFLMTMEKKSLLKKTSQKNYLPKLFATEFHKTLKEKVILILFYFRKW